MIPPEALAQLAGLFDRFANHLDPLSEDWKQRRKEYLDELASFHQRYGVDIPFADFRREAQRACFRWLRSQDRPPTPPPKA